jgi:hypothetical protein
MPLPRIRMKHIQERLNELGWTLDEFRYQTERTSENSKPLAMNTITAVIKGRAVRYDTAVHVARTLGVTLADLTEQQIFPDTLAMLPIPGLSDKILDSLSKACEFDLDKKYPEAVAECDKLLNESQTWEEGAMIQIRRASFQDNGGEHRQALDALEELLAKAGAREGVAALLLRWAEYHKGIALRRLGDLGEAAVVFAGLRGDKKLEHYNAATHQLGVVRLEQAKLQTEDTCRRALLTEALDLFEEAAANWGTENNHRQGFSRRRAAEAHLLLGSIRQAIQAFADALVILARCHCGRYVDETREELLNTLPQKVADSLKCPPANMKASPK